MEDDLIAMVVVEITIWGNWYERESDKYMDKFIESLKKTSIQQGAARRIDFYE